MGIQNSIGLPITANVLKRERLFGKLDASFQKPAIWVTGPAGSGKTVVVSSYLQERALPCLWYQLEDADDDPATFFHYLARAYEKLAGSDALPLPCLTPEYLPTLPQFVRRFFQALYQGLPENFVIAFDNYQEISEHAGVHEFVRYALNELPAHGRIVFLSRAEPPAALVRFYVNQEMAKISWADLRLTETEIIALAQQYEVGNASTQQLAFLQEKLQGWVAGFALVFEHLRDGNDIPERLDLTDADVLLDYFTGEIIAKLDIETREILYRSAFLPTMTPQMIDDLMDINNGDRVLSRLYRNHTFTERLSNQAHVYQYHPLFRKYLRNRLVDVYSEGELADVKRKAAQVLEKNDYLEHSAWLLFETQNWRELCDLTCRHTAKLILQGRGISVAGWFAHLPESVFDDYPWFSYWMGRALLAYDPVASRARFEKAYQKFSNNNHEIDGKLLSWSGVVESYVHEWRVFDELDKWIAEIDFLPSQFPKGISAQTAATFAVSMFSALVYREPDHPDFPIWEHMVRGLLKTDIDINHRIMIGNQLILYYTWIADKPKVQVIMDTMRPDANSDRVAPLTRIVWYSMESLHGWLSVDYEASEVAARKGLEYAEKVGIHIWDFMLCGQACYGKLILGQVDQAAKYLDRMARCVNAGRRLDGAHYYYLGAWLAILESDLPNAYEKARLALEYAIDSGSPMPIVLTKAALSQVLFERGEKERAEEYRKQLSDAGEKYGSFHFRHHGLLLAAYFQLKSGDFDNGLPALRDAMFFGRQHGYWTLTWWRPEMMAMLCGVALENNIETSYVREMISRQSLLPTASHFSLEAWPWAIKIYTLGRFVVLKNSEPLRSTTKSQAKPLELLKVLVAFGGLEVSENKITDVLWPDSDGDLAHHAFNTTLYRLRKLLGNDRIIRMSGGRISLNRQLVWLDVWALEKLSDEVDAYYAAASTSYHNIERIENKAFETYEGLFLEMEADQSWTLPRRERERSRFVRMIERIGQYWMAQEQNDRVIRCYQRAIEVDPLVESFYQQLMIAYQRSGRKAEAKVLFEQCDSTLRAIAGIDPSEKTVSLYQECMAT